MGKSQKLEFEDFLSTVPDEYKEFVVKVDELLIKLGFRQFIDEKQCGLMAKYLHPNKKTIPFKFFYQKDKTLGMHLTVEFFCMFNGSLEKLPSSVLSQIDTIRACIKCPIGCTTKENKFVINGAQKEFCFGGVTVEMDSDGMKIVDLLESKIKCIV